MIRIAILLLAIAATACSSDAPAVGAQLQTPSAVAVFRGVTERRPGIEPYVAVASSGSDQLTLIDPRDDRSVQSPGLVFPLAIPTRASPMFVAAVSLSDGGADALVVAGAPDPATGEVALQLVSTWDGRPRPVAAFPGGSPSRGITVGSGGEVILGLVGAAVPQDAPPENGLVPSVAGVGRFIVSLSGGRLAAVRAARQGDGSIQLLDEGSLALGGAAPFDAISLSAGPDGRRVFASSLDVITGTDGTQAQGVAEIDTLGEPKAWTVRALSARAPTYGVAAARVIERTLTASDDFNRAQVASPRLLVYALPDREACGPTRAVECGVLTIDPVTGDLAEDPLGELPFRAPMRIPVLPIAIATWDRAPAVPTDADQIGVPADASGPLVQVPGIRYTPGTGFRATSAIGIVVGVDGLIYSLDLGRWGTGSDASLLRPPSQTRVVNLVDVTDPNVEAQIGMWNEADPPTTDNPEPRPTLETTPAEMIAQMLVTPGYTPDETWILGWQYPLTGLQGRRSVLVRDDALGLVLAMQIPEATGAGTVWREAVGLYSPLLGVRVGDVVEVALDDVPGLPDACFAVGEGRVAQILPPDPARWPGGALVLSPPVNPPNRAGEIPREDVYACWNGQLASGVHLAAATVGSGEWVLLGASLGHAGRPQPDVRFSLDYPGRNAEGFVEEQLAERCAVPTWPPPEPVPPCDAACRDACEQLAIVRKTRRFYYPQEDCQATPSPNQGVVGCAITGRPPQFTESVLVGPVLQFRFGLNPASVTAEHPLIRTAHVRITTASGLSPSFRAPTVGGQATGSVGFDRSPFTNAEPRIVFYVSYTNNAVYEAALGAFATESKTIR
jgi:hypothetical protein